MSDGAIIAANNLRKEFGQFVAVNNISFQVPAGEFFGLLGPNGAGKSTAMRMIGAVSQRSGGELSVLGKDPNTDGPTIRAQLGVVPQEDNLDLDLTVQDNLYTYGRFFGMRKNQVLDRIPDLVNFAQLNGREKMRIEELSGGMKRRLTIARSLVNDPTLLLLDEPTTGLDPQARHILWDRLYRLKDRGMTMVLTTHFMDEAEQLCDRLVVIDHGVIMDEGSPSQLIARHATKEVLELRMPLGDINTQAQEVFAVAPENSTAGAQLRWEVLPDRILGYADDADSLLAHLHGSDIQTRSTLVRRASLEDVFLRLTGRSLVD